MNGVELLLIAVGLAMDAFAVSVGKGLAIQGQCKKACIVTGLYFGGFQSIMPLLGFLCGESFIQYIAPISRVLSFILLVLIGLNMLRETRKENSEIDTASISPAAMIPAAIATSIDAFAVGVTFAALKVNVLFAILLIGCTAFLFSSAGVKIGNIFGDRMEKQAGILGGFILVTIGVKILVAG
ncbi:manganese efflux pump MntP family protein [Anaerotruncus colihominis]|uniref:manganese efflux pump MntP n=1 Tax=Anaerotruncus colihominis TaxID=169435 RepID=UPI00189AE86B|nr:manganese efflux pump MntP family protein [Anaerotruncus colihominis]